MAGRSTRVGQQAARSNRVHLGPKIKGVAFRTTLQSYGKLKDEEARVRVVSQLPRNLRDALRYGELVPAGWYEIEWYKQLLHAMVEDGGGRRVAQELGVLSARADLGGIYSFLAKALSPQTLFSGASRLFGNYYDTGHVEIVEARKGYGEARWAACTAFDRNMWDEIRGSCEAILDIGGARHVRIHLKEGGGDGQDFMHLQAFWSGS